MNPTLRYFLSLTLKLASNQLHTSRQLEMPSQSQQCKETAEFLSKIILAQRLCHMEIKVFGSSFTTVMPASAQLLLLSMTQT